MRTHVHNPGYAPGCPELEAQKNTLSQFWKLKKDTLSSGTSPALQGMEVPPPPPPRMRMAMIEVLKTGPAPYYYRLIDYEQLLNSVW